jgi:hypothetical protein
MRKRPTAHRWPRGLLTVHAWDALPTCKKNAQFHLRIREFLSRIRLRSANFRALLS